LSGFLSLEALKRPHALRASSRSRPPQIKPSATAGDQATPMAASLTDRSQWKPLGPAFKAAVRAYARASTARLLAADSRNAITAPLYHYTDARGLEGIISAQQIWFTHYQHLNDPSEMEFGISVAKKVLAGPKVKIFCDMAADLFSTDNMHRTFEFYVGSFSRERDDLRQRQVYASNGRGFALGLAPHLFAVEDKPGRKPHENVSVAPVHYGDDAGRRLHLPAIESAAQIIAQTVERKAKLMHDINKGMPFFDEMGKNLIAAELLVNSLTIKHAAYEHEREVRLFIVGEIATLAPYVSTRTRGSDSVPFIKSDMPLQRPGSIAEIVVGPSAPPDAEEFVCALLRPFHDRPESIVRRSAIPYRAF